MGVHPTTERERASYAAGLLERLFRAVRGLTGKPVILGLIDRRKGGLFQAHVIADGMDTGDVIALTHTLLTEAAKRIEEVAHPDCPACARKAAAVAVAIEALATAMAPAPDAPARSEALH